MNAIDEKIRELNEKDGKMFNEILMDNLQDIDWRITHGIDYVNPDFKIAREKTYQEMFKNEYR